MRGAVVGIEIVVERLEGKSKLSQNRSAAERERILGET
jgi:predicted FMN-binding regulatory protein PaiB